MSTRPALHTLAFTIVYHGIAQTGPYGHLLKSLAPLRFLWLRTKIDVKHRFSEWQLKYQNILGAKYCV